MGLERSLLSYVCGLFNNLVFGEATRVYLPTAKDLSSLEDYYYYYYCYYYYYYYYYY